jgi:hypothetical protein
MEQLVLMEAIRTAVPPEVATHIDEHDFHTAEAALTSADNFVLTHRVSNERPPKGTPSIGPRGGSHPGKTPGHNGTLPASDGLSRAGNAKVSDKAGGGSKGNSSRSPMCTHCTGNHRSNNCWKKFPELRPPRPTVGAYVTKK